MHYYFPTMPKNIIKRGDIISCHIDTMASEKDCMMPLCMISFGIRCPQEDISYISQDYSFFMFCTEGKGIMQLDGKKYDIKPGTGWIVASHTTVEYKAVGDIFTTYWFSLKGYMMDDIFEYKNIAFNVKNIDFFIDKFYDFIEIPINEDWKIKMSSMLFEYILYLNEAVRDTIAPPNKYKEFLKPAISYLSYNPDIPYNSAELAKILNITPTHMCRIFKKAYGMQPCEYVQRMKIDFSKRLLTHNVYETISNIARTCGYENVSYFNLIFKKYTGMSPKEYRKQAIVNYRGFNIPR